MKFLNPFFVYSSGGRWPARVHMIVCICALWLSIASPLCMQLCTRRAASFRVAQDSVVRAKNNKTHTHTHTYIYIYIYIAVFFVLGLLEIRWLLLCGRYLRSLDVTQYHRISAHRACVFV